MEAPIQKPPPPSVAIIVPAYQVERWIGQCLESVLAQTFKAFEVIVVDDGSTDGTADTIKRFCADPRVRLIVQRNQGPSVVRNRGLGLAERQGTPFIYFLDANDAIHPRLLERCIGLLQAHPKAEFVRFRCHEVPMDEPSLVGKLPPYPTWGKPEPWARPFDDFRLSDAWAAVWLWVYRRSAIGDLRFPRGIRHEDLSFTWSFVRRARIGFAIPEKLYAYRFNPDSRCHKKLRPVNLRSYAQNLRNLVAEYAREPERLTLLGKTLLAALATKVIWKRTKRESGRHSEMFRLACATLGELVADGTLRLAWFPFRWRFRLLYYRTFARTPRDDSLPAEAPIDGQ